MEKKNIISLVLLIALIISGITNIVLINIYFSTQPREEPPDFVIGTASGPNTIELVDSWDSASNDILHQVVETLFSYDLYDLDLPRINKLAHSYWWENSTKLHIRLKEGVLFHDDTPFNAVAAKWNLDRLQYLINATGTNTGEIALTQSLWMFPDRETFIIDSITTQGDYNITITLNGPYGPFLNALAYINAGMISPTAHAADEINFIDLTTGDIIGTGPFIYNYFVPGKEVILSRWEGYWRNLANFKKIKFSIFDEPTYLLNAMFEGSIDIVLRRGLFFPPTFECDPSITIKRFTDDTGKPSLVYQYLGFNNKKYNVTWRKAFSYAINYTYVVEKLQLCNAVRANSPISSGFGLAYNESSNGANYNLTIARETMISMGFGNMAWNDSQWMSSTFISVPYYYNVGNSFREDLGVSLYHWLNLIGVELIFDSDWLNSIYNDYDQLGIYAIGWCPDYHDPFNILEPLFGPLSGSNSAQVNDTTLNTMMALALETTDDATRNDIYKDIQWYMSEVGYFHAYLYHPKITYIHSVDLYGVPYNAMERFEAYGIRRA